MYKVYNVYFNDESLMNRMNHNFELENLIEKTFFYLINLFNNLLIISSSRNRVSTLFWHTWEALNLWVRRLETMI